MCVCVCVCMYVCVCVLPLCSYISNYSVQNSLKMLFFISNSSIQLSLKIYIVCALFYIFSNCDFIDGDYDIIQYIMYKLAN